MKVAKVALALFLQNLTREMEFKNSFFINTLLTIGWFGSTLITVYLLFLHTNNLAGWTKQQVFLLMGIYRIIESIANSSFRVNFERLPYWVANGELDLFLTKPVPTQLLLSFRYFRIFELPNLAAAIGLVIWALVQTGFTMLNVFLGITFTFFGLLILYALWFTISQIAFWTTRLTSLWEIFNLTQTPGMVPISVYEGTVRFILTIIIPIAFVTTVPAQAFIGLLTWQYALGAIVICAAFLYGSNRLFHFALRTYSSASS